MLAPTRAAVPPPRRRAPLRWLVQGAAVLVVLVVVVVGATAARVWQVGRQDHRGHSDVILVLGAAQYDGHPSSTLRARLDHAVALYRQGVAEHVVTVGGHRPGDRYTEAGTGATYLHQQGVPAAAVVSVPVGTDTLLSLRAARPVLGEHGWHRVTLVTDPEHCLRSRRMAWDLGLGAQTSPTRTGPASSSRITEAHYVARETAGYLYYRVLHLP